MTHRVPDDVAWTVDGDKTSILYLARLPGGPISVLQGTAALIWLSAIDGPAEDLVERVAEVAGVPVADIRDDVDGFVRHLVSVGVLAAAV